VGREEERGQAQLCQVASWQTSLLTMAPYVGRIPTPIAALDKVRVHTAPPPFRPARWPCASSGQSGFALVAAAVVQRRGEDPTAAPEATKATMSLVARA
jgi:hypothetical protein